MCPRWSRATVRTRKFFSIKDVHRLNTHVEPIETVGPSSCANERPGWLDIAARRRGRLFLSGGFTPGNDTCQRRIRARGIDLARTHAGPKRVMRVHRSRDSRTPESDRGVERSLWLARLSSSAVVAKVAQLNIVIKTCQAPEVCSPAHGARRDQSGIRAGRALAAH